MDVLEAILTRRSIRRYTGELVTNVQIETILKAGFYAPSAHNKQPWHFIVVMDKEKLNAISKFHPYAKMATSAGCIIIVCGDKSIQGQTGFLIEDCSASIQNMLLASHGIGLGAVWCGLYPITTLTKRIKELFSLPNKIVPVGMVVVGNKSGVKEMPERIDKTKIHYEIW